MQIKEVQLSKLIPYINNARTHDDIQISQLAASIKEFGFNNPVLLADDQTIIAGHGRVQAAKKLGMKKVPCVYLSHLTETQRKAYVLADNQLALNAGWDIDKMAIELESLSKANFDLDLLGFEDQEISKLLEPDVIEGETDDDEVPEIDENVHQVVPGDIWQLGDHRLMCGDSTNPQHVDALLDGNKIDMVFTDPPYGVSFGDSDKHEKVYGKNKNSKPIKNDEKKGNDLKQFFHDIFSTLSTVVENGCSYYICSPQGGDAEMMMMMMMRENGLKCKHQLIWIKDQPVFSMGRLDYDYQHEPILYGWKGSHKFAGNGEYKKSIWNIKKTESKLHPTMKPVELVENAIKNSTQSSNNTVLDLFLGSGSTLIACEKTHRKCFGMEIDPHYCSVIIERWQNFTGKKAKLVKQPEKRAKNEDG